jgi:stalled ribosome rescue protein Dom34
MSVKNSKQFGVWMDNHHATVVGRENIDNGDFIVLATVDNPLTEKNSSEKAAHNDEITLQHKYFKNIAAVMQNVDEIHITGTGDAQEQFIKFLSETPQYKNAKADESTSVKMSDAQLIELVTVHFN